MLSEVGRRTGKHRGAEVGKSRLSFASARPALISRFSLSTISTGVVLGAQTPNQPLAW
jgi:hypothetical protein